MKKTICLLLAVLMLASLAACGAKQPEPAPVPASTAEPTSEPAPEPAPEAEQGALPGGAAGWSLEGYFIDEEGNMASVTPMELDNESGWFVGFMNGEDPVEDSWGGLLQQEGDVLRGVLASGGDKGEMTVTVSAEDGEGLLLSVDGGETFRFSPYDIEGELGAAGFYITIEADGGWIACAATEEELDFDGIYTWMSFGLSDPTTLVLGARTEEPGRFFSKWTKNGEDFSTEPVITVEVTEDVIFRAEFGFADDGQNPVMNFTGPYASGRARALVEAEGDEDARITVEWSGSASELARWVMSGRLDPETLTVEYSDCVKSIVTYAGDGSVESETVEYENGTGRVVFGEESGFTWKGDQSEQEDLVFEWAWTPPGIEYLVLVNRLNPLPEGWEDELETVTVTNSLGDGAEVEARACEAYLRLKADLEENDGIYLELRSALRSPADQQELMDSVVGRCGAGFAAKTVAEPGFSEHHTGLALDLCFRLKGEDGGFTDVYEYEDMLQYPEIWEKVHAKLADYGFILRCPQGKEQITGYGYEPWHIRYVDDVGLAFSIMSEGITLEEFLAGATAPEVLTDLGSSGLFSPEELEEAAVLIKCRFATFAGCELHSLRYAGDESCSEDNVRWLNELDPEGHYTQAVEFLSDFHSPLEQVGAWEPDHEYTDWQWWLGRAEDGGWNLLSWGY